MTGFLTVVSVGPGDPDLCSRKTLDTLLSAGEVILRTARHPISGWLEENGIRWSSLDDIFECSEDFDGMYGRMADRILEKASREEGVVFAVPDILSDRSLSAAIRCLKESGVPVRIVPGFSYADYYLAACREELDTSNLRVSSASDVSSVPYNPNIPLLITELDNPMLAGDVKEYLSALADDETPIRFMESESVRTIPLYELDRMPAYSHLSAAFIPATDYMHRRRFHMQDLRDIMEALRSPAGCPWDRIQTHQTLRPYLVEEAWESVAAIDEEDPLHMADELGDLLFQIVFHSSIGASFDEFTLDDVISSICAKMIRRHPHVFGDESLRTPGEVADKWEKLKSKENGSRSVSDSLDDVAPSLPALKYAVKVHKKAAQLPAWKRDAGEIAESMGDLARKLGGSAAPTNEDAVGDLLFLCAHYCFLRGVDPEIALHRTVDRFRERFRLAEKAAVQDGKSPECLTFSELCVYLKHVEGEIE
ncbi:MAG: nucleoside triphosphate pyrophosphohydrolase [Clostridiales bacterium]|nr:nucleoside triphosphate pyrophosphohydrolase [Clostridiales bacterium]